MAFLVVGLGNPGKEYKNTRHNIGFMVIDNLADDTQIKLDKTGFSGIYGTGVISKYRVFLFKPATFMNNSGKAVKEIKNFYKIKSEDMIVVHDEIDLELGNVKVKFGGGTAGHKGLNSIVQDIGDRNFNRIRLGIGKPANKYRTTNYVLSNFNEEENKLVIQSIIKASDAVKEIINNGIVSALNKINQKNLEIN